MDNIKEKINKALDLKKRDQFEEALDILNGIFESNDKSEDVKKALIEVLFDYGGYLNDEWVLGYEKAAECFNRIIELDVNNYRAWYNLGISLFNIGRTENALKAYEQAINLKPDYEYIYYNIGLLYEVHKGDLETALKFYEKALSINSNFTYALQASRDVRQKLEYFKLNMSDKTVDEFDAVIVCKNCGNVNRAGARYCDKCGELIE